MDDLFHLCLTPSNSIMITIFCIFMLQNSRYVNSEDGLNDDDEWEDITEPELGDMNGLTTRTDPQQQVS